MIQIRLAEELLRIQKTDEVVLMNDIDFGDRKLECIIPEFRGVLNGNGYTISNIVVSCPVWGDEQKIALFNYISHAKVKDIVFKGIKFDLMVNSYSPSIAALGVEVNDSVIDNVKMYVNTSNLIGIPLLYEANGVETHNLEITCNGVTGKTIKYKEGSLV